MASKNGEISIDDFHPRNDGFSQSYKGTWREQGMIATAWLEPVEPGRFPRGVYLRGAYKLGSTYENRPGRAISSHQEERGADLACKLRERMQEEMQSAGWQVVAQGREGINLWQYKPTLPATQETPERPAPAIRDQPERKPGEVTSGIRRPVLIPAHGKVKAHERIVTQRMTFSCKECGETVTRHVYPGKVWYCEPCAKEVERRKRNERRMKSYYASKEKKREVEAG